MLTAGPTIQIMGHCKTAAMYQIRNGYPDNSLADLQLLYSNFLMSQVAITLNNPLFRTSLIIISAFA